MFVAIIVVLTDDSGNPVGVEKREVNFIRTALSEAAGTYDFIKYDQLYGNSDNFLYSSIIKDAPNLTDAEKTQFIHFIWENRYPGDGLATDRYNPAEQAAAMSGRANVKILGGVYATGFKFPTLADAPGKPLFLIPTFIDP